MFYCVHIYTGTIYNTAANKGLNKVATPNEALSSIRCVYTSHVGAEGY